MKSLLLCLCMIASLSAEAGSEAAKALVKKAVSYYKQNGRPALVKEVSSKSGSLRNGQLYVFVYDLEGNVVSHGQLVTLIGRNMLSTKDSKGRFWVKERVEMAKEKGSGWQEYSFMNPVNKKFEEKRAYFELTDDLIIGCGIYNP